MTVCVCVWLSLYIYRTCASGRAWRLSDGVLGLIVQALLPVRVMGREEERKQKKERERGMYGSRMTEGRGEKEKEI